MATSIYRANPSSLRFTQISIANHFKAPHEHVRIDDAVCTILRKELHPDKFPTIRVVKHSGQLFSLDNRRLWVFRKAGVASIKISYVSRSYHARSREFFDSLTPSTVGKFSAPNFFPKVRGGGCRTNFDEPMFMPKIDPPNKVPACIRPVMPKIDRPNEVPVCIRPIMPKIDRPNEAPACIRPIRPEACYPQYVWQIRRALQEEPRVVIHIPPYISHEASTNPLPTKQKGCIQRFMSWMRNFSSGVYRFFSRNRDVESINVDYCKCDGENLQPDAQSGEDLDKEKLILS